MFRLGLYSVGDDIVYGGAGQDTVDYSGETQDLTITFTGVVSSSGEKFWKVSGDGEFSQSGGNQSYYTYDDKLFSIENITGGSGNDTITAGEDANTLNGSEGDDILAGGAGDDYLIGGAGADIFVFSSSAQGADWIEDFTVNEDRIDISDITSFDDFSDVIAIAEELDGTTWLKFDETNSIRLQNVALHSLSANDFMLA
ncbi:M10 family metallopeptidase C-terminal domain-containing protein [Agrobacterium vitis]